MKHKNNRSELILTRLCMNYNAEDLFITIYGHIYNESPCLVELLAIYAFPNFGLSGKRIVTDLVIKKCIKLLKNMQKCNLSEDNSIDYYVAGVRGFAYAHQIEEKIKVLSKNMEDHFIQQIGFSPERILVLIKACYLILNDKIVNKEKLIIFKAELKSRINFIEDEWTMLIDKFAFTKEKFFNQNITNINLRNYAIFSISEEAIMLAHLSHFLDLVSELFQSNIEKHEHFEAYNKERGLYLESRLSSALNKFFPNSMVK